MEHLLSILFLFVSERKNKSRKEEIEKLDALL